MEGSVYLGSLIAAWLGIEPATAWLQVQRPGHYATKPQIIVTSKQLNFRECVEHYQMMCDICHCRPLAYSTLADLVHHVRQSLSLSDLALAVNLFSKNVHDESLPCSIQTMSCKLLLNLVECIRAKSEAENGNVSHTCGLMAEQVLYVWFLWFGIFRKYFSFFPVVKIPIQAMSGRWNSDWCKWLFMWWLCIISKLTLLCSCPVGHVMRLACLSVPYGLTTLKQKGVEESKLGWTFFRAQVSGMPIFRWKGQRSRSLDVKNHRKLASFLLTVKRIRRRQIEHRLQMPLLGLIYCRHLNMRRSATGQTDGCMSCRHSAICFLVKLFTVWIVRWRTTVLTVRKKCNVECTVCRVWDIIVMRTETMKPIIELSFHCYQWCYTAGSVFVY